MTESEMFVFSCCRETELGLKFGASVSRSLKDRDDFSFSFHFVEQRYNREQVVILGDCLFPVIWISFNCLFPQ